MTVFIQQGDKFGVLEQYIDEAAPFEENYDIVKNVPSHIDQGIATALGGYSRLAYAAVASGSVQSLVNAAPAANSVVKGSLYGTTNPYYVDILLNPLTTPRIKMRFMFENPTGNFAIYTTFSVALVHVIPTSDVVGTVFTGWVGVSSGARVSTGEGS